MIPNDFINVVCQSIIYKFPMGGDRVHYFLGLSIADWSGVIAIGAAVVTAIFFVAKLRDSIDQLNTTIAQLNGTIGSVRADVSRLDERVDEHDRRLDRHHEQIKNLYKQGEQKHEN